MNDLVNSQIKVDLKSAPTFLCKECECMFFEPSFILKKVSKVITGGMQDQILPIQIFRCSDCGTPLEETLPNKELLKNG